MSSPFHEHVSGVAPLDGAIDGSPRPKPRPTSKPKVVNPVGLGLACKECGLRSDSPEIDNDPHKMNLHLNKEAAGLRARLEHLEEEAASLSAFVTTAQAAAISGLNKSAVIRLCHAGILSKAVQWDGRWLVERGEIESYERRKSDVSKNWDKRHGWKRWTKEEIDFLRSHQQLTARRCAEHLGRPLHWVESHRGRMRKLEGEEVWPKKPGGWYPEG